MPAPPPYYNAAPPAEPLSSFITRELGQQVPAAAAPVQEAAVVAARAYAGPDPVLHAGYDAAARSRVARRAALLGNQMAPARKLAAASSKYALPSKRTRRSLGCQRRSSDAFFLRFAFCFLLVHRLCIFEPANPGCIPLTGFLGQHSYPRSDQPAL